MYFRIYVEPIYAEIHEWDSSAYLCLMVLEIFISWFVHRNMYEHYFWVNERKWTDIQRGKNRKHPILGKENNHLVLTNIDHVRPRIYKCTMVSNWIGVQSFLSRKFVSVPRDFLAVALCDFFLCFKANGRKIPRHKNIQKFSTQKILPRLIELTLIDSLDIC